MPPAGDRATPPRAHPTTLTSVDVTVRTLSRSSTSCLKVGRCEGTACQHSRMIMYLHEMGEGTITHGGAKQLPPTCPLTPNRLKEQLWPMQLQPWWPWCVASLGEEEGFVEPHSSLLIMCVCALEAGKGTVLKMTLQSCTPHRHPPNKSRAELKCVGVDKPTRCQLHNLTVGMSHQPEPWPRVAFWP